MTTPPPPDGGPDTPAWSPPDGRVPARDAPSRLPVHVPGPPHVAARTTGPPPVPVPGRRNRVVVIALVTGLCATVSLGTGLAVAASGGSPFATADAESRPPPPPGLVAVSTLEAGACFNGYTEEYAEPAAVRTPCERRHGGEIGAKATLLPGPFPDEQRLLAEATYQCKERTAFLTDRPAASALDLRIDMPDEDDWAHGNREVTCLLVHTGSGGLTGSLATSPKTRTAHMPEMEPGTCVERWDSRVDDQPVTECTEAHEAQLYAKFTLKGVRYPGDRKLDEVSNARCFGRSLAVLEKRLPKRVELIYVRPSEESWAAGDRLLYCLAKSTGKPLKRTLLRKRRS
ncbi:septum formation family protein [Actinomadura spongiicola]|uniref:septum formation family protein n=1 Tax=Actinomadura spongiicola TaxID=2303421 RepID=UPI0013148810|nr:septum formation family protein [Actinomadura spongiicola]